MTTGNIYSVGVGIVSYNNPEILQKSLNFVLSRTPSDVPVVVYDDASYSCNFRMLKVMPEFGSRLHCIRSAVNRGAAYGRNRICEFYDDLGFKRVAILDMDIEVKDGWLSDLNDKMDQHINCGAVSFFYCNNNGGHFPIYEEGMCPEVATMCYLLRIEALDDMLGPDMVWGMDERMELLCHDSEFFQRMKKSGKWKLYLIKDKIKEITRSHSVNTGCTVINKEVIDRRERDCKIWGEMSDKRNWEKDKIYMEPRGDNK
jgi:glycosyltransferase involved in cell wall biosynthesis